MSTVDRLMSHGPPLLPSIPAVPAADNTFYFPPPPNPFDGTPSTDSLPNLPPPCKPLDGTPSANSLPDPLPPSADSLPSGFTHPTAHLPGNAEETNSNRPDALPASSMAEDSTEDSRSLSHSSTSRPSSILSHTSTSHPSSIPSHPSTLAEDSHPSSIPSHTSTSANTENEAQADEIQNNKGSDSGRPRRTRRAHIPSTRNIIANSIGNNCKENVSKQKDQGCELNTICCSLSSHARFLWSAFLRTLS
ncbi:hypothetical protein EDD22DRAFT_951551 [Suillus occidentalis]|nr:hypothetical protein EDD22DRAFT_951551 [Suillus occidentalis]